MSSGKGVLDRVGGPVCTEVRGGRTGKSDVQARQARTVFPECTVNCERASHRGVIESASHCDDSALLLYKETLGTKVEAENAADDVVSGLENGQECL